MDVDRFLWWLGVVAIWVVFIGLMVLGFLWGPGPEQAPWS